MEFVLVFPLFLVTLLGIVQFAHIWLARLVVQYAAFCAARTALVCVAQSSNPTVSNESWPRLRDLRYLGMDGAYTQGDSIARGRVGTAQSEAEYFGSRVAARVCQCLVMSESAADLGGRTAAWDRGEFAPLGAAERKTRATVTLDEPSWTIRATVEHDFSLVVPIVGEMLAWGMRLWTDPAFAGITRRDDTDDAHLGPDLIGFPHLRLTETAWLPKPYRTAIAMEDWH